MPRRYTITLEDSDLTTATDLIKIVPEDDTIVELVHLEVKSLSEAADAWTINILRGGTGGGTLNAIVPAPLDPGDAAFSGTVYNLSAGDSDVSGGTLMHSTRGDVRVGAFFQRAPGEGIIASGSSILHVRSADAITTTGVSIHAEIIETG